MFSEKEFCTLFHGNRKLCLKLHVSSAVCLTTYHTVCKVYPVQTAKEQCSCNFLIQRSILSLHYDPLLFCHLHHLGRIFFKTFFVYNWGGIKTSNFACYVIWKRQITLVKKVQQKWCRVRLKTGIFVGPNFSLN